jgi:hypothetical protein
MVWTVLIWHKKGTSGHGNELSGSIKCWEILEELSNWRLLKKGPAPWSYVGSVELHDLEK